MRTVLPRPSAGVTERYMGFLVAAIEQAMQRQVSKVNGVVVVDADQPVALRAPNGTLYRITVDDAGVLGTEVIEL